MFPDNIVRERTIPMNEIVKQVEEFGFTGYVTSLSQCLSPHPIIYGMTDARITPELDNVFLETLDSSLDLTARQQLLRHLHAKLIHVVALKLNHNKVLISDSSWDIAVNILSDMCQGRGKNISSSVAFVDIKHPDIMVLRPMREFSNPEIDYYLKFHCIDVVKSVKEEVINSIQSLTENFISELDSVSTVLRTGEKFGDEIAQGGSCCLLCRGSLDTLLTHEFSAIQSIDFSKRVSTNTMHETNYSNQNLLQEFIKSLCYGCRLIFNHINRIEDIPKFLLDCVEQKLMLESIQNFLI